MRIAAALLLALWIGTAGIGADPARVVNRSELYAGVRLDGYTNFSNYASGLVGLDLQYTRDFASWRLPFRTVVDFLWGARLGMVFDGLYNVDSKTMQPRFFPVYLPVQPLVMADLHITDRLSWRLGTADGIALIVYPHGVVSLNFDFHVLTGVAYRFTDRWGIELSAGWGWLGKWSYWGGPQFALGAFYR
jgi:hypothetical protein